MVDNAPQFRTSGMLTHRMIVVFVAGIAAALFAAGLAISAAFDRTHKDRTRHAASAPSAREIDVEIQSHP